MKNYILTGLAIATAMASTPALAVDLLDLTDLPQLTNVPYTLSFTAGSPTTTISIAGYEQPSFLQVTSIGLFLNNSGANLLGTTWDYTPAPAGAFASQFADGAVNGLILGGVVEGSYDVFSQSIATVSGSSYTLAFLLSNSTPNDPGSTTPSGFRVSASDASAVSAVPEPATWALMILGFGAVGYSMRRRNVKTTITFA